MVPQSGVQGFIRRAAQGARRCCPWRASIDIRFHWFRMGNEHELTGIPGPVFGWETANFRLA